MTIVKLSSALSLADRSVLNNVDVENISFESQGEGQPEKLKLLLANEDDVIAFDQNIDLQEDGTAIAQIVEDLLDPDANETRPVTMQFHMLRPLMVGDVEKREQGITKH